MKNILWAVHSETASAYSRFKSILKKEECRFTSAIDVTEALNKVQEHPIQLVILDPILALGEGNPEGYREFCPGLDLLDKILEMKPETQFIILSVYLNDFSILRELATKNNIIAQILPYEPFGHLKFKTIIKRFSTKGLLV